MCLKKKKVFIGKVEKHFELCESVEQIFWSSMLLKLNDEAKTKGGKFPNN